MALLFGAVPISALRFGPAPVIRLYFGATKVWQGWLAARLNVTATVQGTGANWLNVPSVTAADAQTVVSGTSVVVQGTKNAARVTVQVNVSGGISPDSRVRILVNENVVATSGANGASFSYSWAGPLKDRDTVRFQYYGEGSFFSRPTLQTSSYLTIA